MKRIYNILLSCTIALSLLSCTAQDWNDTGVSSPYHDCSIMQYLRGDTYNWELTVKLIERAGLTDLFEGTDPAYREITFFAPPSYSVLRYLWDNGMETVDEMDIDQCKTLVLRHVLAGKHLKADFAYRNVDYTIDDDLQDGGTDLTTLGGSNIRVYRDKSGYGGVPDVGPETMYIYSFTRATMVPLATPDIQPLNGVVHALNYNYGLGRI